MRLQLRSGEQSTATKSEALKKVRRQTDQILKQQHAQNEERQRRPTRPRTREREEGNWRRAYRSAEASSCELRRKRMDICEHMEVVDANGQHVGIVEKVEGDRIKLTEKDALDPQHLFLDKSQIAGIEGNKVKLLQKVSAITTRAFLSR
jgi:hypothetical protein